ncbi:MAG: hypothetical protein COA99_00370 [Moraxellaceae bacterium]|nr:MAG: hypothetical protein COA99_00370 [Moraxellaceae bacterium]
MTSIFKIMALPTAIAASSLLISNVAFADTNTDIEALKARIDKLSEMQTERTTPAIAVSGVVEVEVGYATDYNDDKTSDIVAATVALAFEANIAEGVHVQVGLLHEEDVTPLEVDEAHISFEKDLLSVNAGVFYIPFGSFASNLVSDPLTLDLAETRESTVEVGVSMGPISTSVYVFNGDVDDNGGAQDKTEMFGLSFTFARESGALAYEFGADYINNFADVGGLEGTVVLSDDYVAGISVDAAVSFGDINVFVEYTTAQEEFETADLAFEGEGAKPAAFNIEAGYLLSLGKCETQFAIAYQGTKEALALGLPEKRIAIAASTLIADNTSLSLEYARNTDYDETEGGTGDDATAITLQLAVEF